jgi:uncharacterized membrane protein
MAESKIIGNRKFIIAIISTIGNMLLVAFSKIDPGVYSVVAVAIIGSYIAGNVIQNVSLDRSSNSNS